MKKLLVFLSLLMTQNVLAGNTDIGSSGNQNGQGLNFELIHTAKADSHEEDIESAKAGQIYLEVVRELLKDRQIEGFVIATEDLRGGSILTLASPKFEKDAELYLNSDYQDLGINKKYPTQSVIKLKGLEARYTDYNGKTKRFYCKVASQKITCTPTKN